MVTVVTCYLLHISASATEQPSTTCESELQPPSRVQMVSSIANMDIASTVPPSSSLWRPQESRKYPHSEWLSEYPPSAASAAYSSPNSPTSAAWAPRWTSRTPWQRARVLRHWSYERLHLTSWCAWCALAVDRYGFWNLRQMVQSKTGTENKSVMSF